MQLKSGSTGEDVKKLQAKLGIPASGIFDLNTENKVKQWQMNNRLPATGIIDQATWNRIFGLAVNVSPAAPPPHQAASSFKLDKLKGKIPDAVISQIPDTAAKFEIITPLRLAHFLAQCGHESGGFKLVYENLNYSVEGLLKIFGKYFTREQAEQYARKPEKIGARVYAGRMGNGDEASGEGYRYRGRGYIQLTGKDNYRAFTRFIGEDTVANPDLVATKYPMASAGFYFQTRKIWTTCDKGATDQIVKEVTRLVNGGEIGLPDRIKHFQEYYNLLK